MPCSKIVGIVNWAGKATDVIQTKYPSCQAYLNGTSPNQYVVVQATANNGIENSAALLDIIFGMSIWLAIFIHALGIEVYVRPVLFQTGFMQETNSYSCILHLANHNGLSKYRTKSRSKLEWRDLETPG